MSALQFIVQGGQKLSGTIYPSGNKNAALPIICAALLTEHPVTLNNVPRIRDVETLVELIASAGVDVNWIDRNTQGLIARGPDAVIEENRFTACLASHEHELRKFAVKAKQHPAGVVEYAGHVPMHGGDLAR